jgi:transmembrane sensor
MSTDEDQVREMIAAQAGDWLAAHRPGALEVAEQRAFFAWLTASPIHVEEYLGVAAIARRLPTVANDPEMPLEAILERIRAESGSVARLEDASATASTRAERRPQRRWWWGTVPAALLASALLWWNVERATTEHYATGHGELRSWQLKDHSILRLNTDSSVTVRYSRSERLVELATGEALFEVTPEARRPFRVLAGNASALAVGTSFSVRREASSTLVTVVHGRVAVSALSSSGGMALVNAGEQVRVADGNAPGPVSASDIERSTAWLHRQIIFEREPLAMVAAEFNRYSPLPIEIETPELRRLQISGIFSVDDTETFLDFLRTLPRVNVDATSRSIRVFASPPPSPAPHPVQPPP